MVGTPVVTWRRDRMMPLLVRVEASHPLCNPPCLTCWSPQPSQGAQGGIRAGGAGEERDGSISWALSQKAGFERRSSLKHPESPVVSSVDATLYHPLPLGQRLREGLCLI
ncbi:hypothetical protein AAFF_G00260870 [Aldrovandia affinis]|uniref:Uncharacterized protein n=1 Tax=Aldrovandia affinis TaxID=143900 RepID=A0AAD7RCF7_9TELE|nr:hypothetical protein AAFF_G00260870 [Aldrovandia affinis]